jgi:ClpP class serine protease
MAAIDLQNELKRLISEYNHLKNTYLLIYAVDFEKGAQIPGLNISLIMNDYHVIHELLRDVQKSNIDFYLETPGGSGEAAEEIVNFLHKKFETVNFIIVGESKSAGTLMTMSADEIYIADSGSLGPIDAQVRVGRSMISAFDYVNWIEEKRRNVLSGMTLDAIDAAMIAQI